MNILKTKACHRVVSVVGLIINVLAWKYAYPYFASYETVCPNQFECLEQVFFALPIIITASLTIITQILHLAGPDKFKILKIILLSLTSLPIMWLMVVFFLFMISSQGVDINNMFALFSQLYLFVLYTIFTILYAVYVLSFQKG